MARARTKYQPVVCEDDKCKPVGRASSSLEKAKRKMQREVRKLSKRRFKTLPRGGRKIVMGEVWETQRGKTISDAPVYIGVEGYGEVSQRPPRKRRGKASGVDEPA